MAGMDRDLSEYLDSLPVESEASRFLRSMPWVYDSGPQDPEQLLPALRREAELLSDLPRRPLFSLVTPMYSTPPRLLRELILSVRLQTWPEWELLLVDDGSPDPSHLALAREWSLRDSRIKLFACEENRGISGARNFAIERASGDFLCVLDHDDILHPSALGTYARAVNADPGVNFLFSNECQMNDEGTRAYGFFSKPYLDVFTVFRTNYVCHFTAIGRDLLVAAMREGRAFRSEYDGAEDHDLILRLALSGRMKPQHIPLILYFWRAVPTSCSMALEAKPEIPARRLRMLDELLPEAYPGGTFRVHAHVAEKGECHLTIQIRSLHNHPRPKLLVLVPFRDRPLSTLRALDSIERQGHGMDVEVVLIDNRSAEPGTIPTLLGWMSEEHRNRYRIVRHDGAWNPSKMLNDAAAGNASGKDLILFLRNDVELIGRDALQTLAMQALADPNCGFVGLKLRDPNGGDVRHGGYKVASGVDGSGYHRIESCCNGREFPHDEHVILGVSFACAMTRAEVFAQLDGLDAARFCDDLADVDLCLRAIEAGYRNYYFGTQEAIDHGTAHGIGELALATLYERHAKTLEAWRVRLFRHADFQFWPAPTPHPVVLEVTRVVEVPTIVEVPVILPLPMRYKAADKLNAALKKALGPVHGWVKVSLSRSVRLARRVRTARKAGHPLYRPNFLKKKRIPRS